MGSKTGEVKDISFRRDCLESKNSVRINFYRGNDFGFYSDPKKGEKWGEYARKVLTQIQLATVGEKEKEKDQETKLGDLYRSHTQTMGAQTFIVNDGFSFSQTGVNDADVIVLAGSLNPDIQGYIPPFYRMAKKFLPQQEVKMLEDEFSDLSQYWNSHITHRDTYCRRSNGGNKKLSFIEPIVHESDYFLSGRACLRSMLLSLACVNVDFSRPDKVKQIDGVFFQGGNSDRLTETGKSLLRSHFEEARK